MNFLAHLHLAEPTPESRLGNLLGDFVKGLPWDGRYSPEIWMGIMEHRYVDSFTDSHDAWKQSRNLLPGGLRRYAGIVVDIYYDYFLHLHWEQFSDGVPIETFIESAHDDLESILSTAPNQAREAIRAMISQRWLTEYASLEGIERTLHRVSHRSPILHSIFDASEVLARHLPKMEQHFLEFYPDLLDYMAPLRKKLEVDRSEE
ncbi:MAG: ACP phosphodiesterase [Verrucomicrobiales bacterium]|nr:ACP phosphodiesterase [Verrucomicrobiales bacterium]